MKMQIKSYRAFVRQIYRMTEIVLLPAALLLAYGILMQLAGLPAMEIFVGIYMQFDMVLDFWIFGGICSKNSVGLEFVKSSSRGYETLKAALVTDQLRRFVMSVLLAVGMMAITVRKGQAAFGAAELWYMALLILVPYTVSTLLLSVLRHIDFFQIYLLVSCAGGGFVSGMLTGLQGPRFEDMIVTKKSVIVVGVLLVLGIAGTVGTVRHTLARAKRSYRDSNEGGRLCLKR